MKKLYGETPGKNWRWTKEATDDSCDFAEMAEKQVNSLMEKGYTIPEIELMFHTILVNTMLNFKLGINELNKKFS